MVTQPLAATKGWNVVAIACRSAGRLGRCTSYTFGNSSQPVSSRQSRTAASPDGGSISTGPNSAWSSPNTRVGTPHPPSPVTRSWSARTSSCVLGSSMAWPTRAGSSPSRPIRASATSRRSGGQVPAVQQRRVDAAQQRADPHHRPAVGPLALPRVLLALGPVDFLEAEEAPPDLHAQPVPDLAHPDRRLVRPRAHDVEVEVDRRDRCVHGSRLRPVIFAANGLRSKAGHEPSGCCTRL